MDKTQKMLQTVINGQSAVKSELLGEIGKLRKDMNKGFEDVNNKMDKGFKKVNERIDKLGKSLSYLEDDAPTIEEFDKLEKRVAKVEQKTVTI